MKNEKNPKELSVVEAVDYLSSLAELEKGSVEESAKRWLDPSQIDHNQQTIKQSLKAVHKHLLEIYEKDRKDLKNQDTQKKVQAMMNLVGEAGEKLDKFTPVFKESKAKVTDLEEYRELQRFYTKKILKKFQKTLELEEAWQSEWGKMDDSLLDIHQKGLKDLETVKRDKDYDLFYVKKEDGKPFFNPNLVRHIRLVGDLDELLMEVEGEDPFLKVRAAQDRDLHASAQEILRLSSTYIDMFYKEAMHHKHKDFVSSLGKALMALMLAANPRNLIHNTAGKSSISYYKDFHAYLREALSSEDYQLLLASPDQGDKFLASVVNLSHALCFFFFMRVGSRKEAIDFLHKLIEKGGYKKNTNTQAEKELALWDTLLEEDESIRAVLKKYPSGPLMKTLDTFREQGYKKGFDPIQEQGFPCQMYSFQYEENHVSILHLASPTRQEFINTAHVVEEFKGFLRSLHTKVAEKKHLLFNLQDRTAWQEHARCQVLEEMQKHAEFARNVVVVTLAKNTEFYFQSASYAEVNSASLFKKHLKEQLESGTQCGFFFGSALPLQEVLNVAEKMIEKIHECFFMDKKQLTRTERLDFIEIFYHFFMLKIIEIVKPDSVSFTSKDSVDTGAAAAAGFYSFVRMTEERGWDDKEKDFLLWMLYSSAFSVRERAIDTQDLHRMVSALVCMHSAFSYSKKEIADTFGKLFSKGFFKNMKVEEVEEA